VVLIQGENRGSSFDRLRLRRRILSESKSLGDLGETIGSITFLRSAGQERLTSLGLFGKRANK
jgi:hypothetical protein